MNKIVVWYVFGVTPTDNDRNFLVFFPHSCFAVLFVLSQGREFLSAYSTALLFKLIRYYERPLLTAGEIIIRSMGQNWKWVAVHFWPPYLRFNWYRLLRDFAWYGNHRPCFTCSSRCDWSSRPHPIASVAVIDKRHVAGRGNDPGHFN